MNRSLIVIALSTAILAGPASAEMYLGAGVGAAKTDVHKTSWKLYGGFQFDPIWGIEAAYTDLGRYGGSSVEARSLAGTVTQPFAERWSLLAKLGASSNRSNFAGASNHTDLLAGLGIGYNLAKNIGVRLEYEDFGKLSNGSTINNSRGSNWGLSMKYGF